jgi:hypothetical protein
MARDRQRTGDPDELDPSDGSAATDADPRRRPGSGADDRAEYDAGDQPDYDDQQSDDDADYQADEVELPDVTFSEDVQPVVEPVDVGDDDEDEEYEEYDPDDADVEIDDEDLEWDLADIELDPEALAELAQCLAIKTAWDVVAGEVNALHEVVASLVHSGPAEPVSSLQLRAIDRAIDLTGRLLEGDHIVDAVEPFGDEAPEYRDALTVLAELRGALVRFQQGRWSFLWSKEFERSCDLAELDEDEIEDLLADEGE